MGAIRKKSNYVLWPGLNLMKYSAKELHAVRKGDSFANFGQHLHGKRLEVCRINGHEVNFVEDVMSVGRQS